jgi:hypothetical protein
MTEEVGTIPINQLPANLTHSIEQNIEPYIACMIGLRRGQIKPEFGLFGSGTFLQVLGIHGILTAHHVVEALQSCDRLGLALKLPYEHRWTIPVNSLHFINIGIPVEPEWGPDLAVILLPEDAIGHVKSLQTFYNLGKSKNEYVGSQLLLRTGAWGVSGFPQVLTQQGGYDTRFIFSEGYKGVLGFVAPPREWVRGEYDYFEVDVSWSNDDTVPKDYRGVSGGGLWHIPLSRRGGSALEHGRPTLAGVAFYQTSVEQSKRTIRCHGANSIYEKVYEAIEKYSH